MVPQATLAWRHAVPGAVLCTLPGWGSPHIARFSKEGGAAPAVELVESVWFVCVGRQEVQWCSPDSVARVQYTKTSLSAKDFAKVVG